MYMPLCRECWHHKNQQKINHENNKMEVGSADQKEHMLSSSSNSTAFNGSSEDRAEPIIKEKCIDMNQLRQLENSIASVETMNHQIMTPGVREFNED